MLSTQEKLQTSIQKKETTIYFDGLEIKDLIRYLGRRMGEVGIAIGKSKWWLAGCLKNGRAARMSEADWNDLCKELMV